MFNITLAARVGKYLEGMNGRQVLGMKREDLETAFGEHEGKRLDSQITLSRSEDITSSQNDEVVWNTYYVVITTSFTSIYEKKAALLYQFGYVILGMHEYRCVCL